MVALRGELRGLRIAGLAQVPPELGHRGVSPDRLADWVAELSNQLAGRVKSKLLRYRVVVTLGALGATCSGPASLSQDDLGADGSQDGAAPREGRRLRGLA
jgi:hypothetical protein